MGIDHHRQYSHITLLDEKGKVLKSGRVANLRLELEDFLCGIKEVRAVVEAGRLSCTMVDALDDMGISTTVAHPKEVKASPHFADDQCRNMIAAIIARIPAIRFAPTHTNIKIATS